MYIARDVSPRNCECLIMTYAGVFLVQNFDRKNENIIYWLEISVLNILCFALLLWSLQIQIRVPSTIVTLILSKIPYRSILGQNAHIDRNKILGVNCTLNGLVRFFTRNCYIFFQIRSEKSDYLKFCKLKQKNTILDTEIWFFFAQSTSYTHKAKDWIHAFYSNVSPFSTPPDKILRN